MTASAHLASPHDHVFLGDRHQRNERRTWLVIAITATMMVAEIVAGNIYGSMALVADGWHMSTHAGAMLIAALAYAYARRHARNTRFSFGTGKMGDLAGFASAVVLALIALLIGWESLTRLYSPVTISFPQAISVAVVGLTVNLLCAWLLRDEPHGHPGHGHHGHGHHGHGNLHAQHGHRHHGHGHHGDGHHGHQHAHPAPAHDHHAHHDHDEGHTHGHPAQDHGTAPRAPARDNNLRAAYLHVLADALTSVLAIVALVMGSIYGWNWMDPAMGIVGGLVIARWSWGLIRDTGAVLLDYAPEGDDLPHEIRAALETGSDRITDLHIWQLGPGHHGAIVSIRSESPQPPAAYKARLARIAELSHVTVEVEGAHA